MHSLCAACSVRLSPLFWSCSGVLHVLSKRAHVKSWVIKHYMARDIFIQQTWLGFTWFLISPICCKQKSVLTSELLLAPPLFPDTLLNTRLEVRWIDGKMKASLFMLQFYPSTPQQFLRIAESAWLAHCALTDKLEDNTINLQWDLKLAMEAHLRFLCERRFSNPPPPPVPCHGVGTSQYRWSVEMWNELPCANRNGCHRVDCCSLLRSNNKIRDRSISESGGSVYTG